MFRQIVVDVSTWIANKINLKLHIYATSSFNKLMSSSPHLTPKTKAFSVIPLHLWRFMTRDWMEAKSILGCCLFISSSVTRVFFFRPLYPGEVLAKPSCHMDVPTEVPFFSLFSTVPCNTLFVLLARSV